MKKIKAGDIIRVKTPEIMEERIRDLTEIIEIIYPALLELEELIHKAIRHGGETKAFSSAMEKLKKYQEYFIDEVGV